MSRIKSLALLVALLWAVQASAQTTIGSDNFSAYSAEASLSGTWVHNTTNAGSKWYGLSGQAGPKGATQGSWVYWNDTFDSEMWGQATFTVIASTSYMGVTVRQTSDAFPNEDAYLCGQWATPDYQIVKIVNDTGTILKDTNITIVANDVVKCEATGGATTTINLYVNGSLADSITDSSSPLSGGFAGLGGYAVGAVGLDDWSGGNVSSGGGGGGGTGCRLTLLGVGGACSDEQVYDRSNGLGWTNALRAMRLSSIWNAAYTAPAAANATAIPDKNPAINTGISDSLRHGWGFLGATSRDLPHGLAADGDGEVDEQAAQEKRRGEQIQGVLHGRTTVAHQTSAGL